MPLHHYLCFCKPQGAEQLISTLYQGDRTPFYQARGHILMDWLVTLEPRPEHEFLDFWKTKYEAHEYFFEPSAEYRLLHFLQTGDAAYLQTSNGEIQTQPMPLTNVDQIFILPPSLDVDISDEIGMGGDD